MATLPDLAAGADLNLESSRAEPNSDKDMADAPVLLEALERRSAAGVAAWAGVEGARGVAVGFDVVRDAADGLWLLSLENPSRSATKRKGNKNRAQRLAKFRIKRKNRLWLIAGNGRRCAAYGDSICWREISLMTPR